MPEGRAVKVLHGDEGLAFRFSDVIDGADVGMVEGGGGLRFSLKAGQGLRVFRDILWQEFQGDVAMQTHVFGLVHHTHSATTEFFENTVMGYGLSDERVGTRHDGGHLRLRVWS